MNNYDRIFQEIQRESRRISPEYGVNSDELLNLTMGIVDQEDKHSIKSIAINKIVEQEIMKLVDQMSERKGYKNVENE